MDSMVYLLSEGHLNVLFKIFSFLKRKHNGVTVFDPTDPEVDQTQFPTEDWSVTHYGLFKEDVPLNAPVPRGTYFTMRAFVDSDHAGDSINRSSRTGFIAFLRNASIFVH